MTNSNKPTPAPTNPTIDDLLKEHRGRIIDWVTYVAKTMHDTTEAEKLSLDAPTKQALYAAILNSLPKGSLMYREDVLARVKALFDIQEGTNNDL